jgi:hypothetical protein
MSTHKSAGLIGHPRLALVLLALVCLGLLSLGGGAVSAQPEPALIWLGAPDLTPTGAPFNVAGEILAGGDLSAETVTITKREMGSNVDTPLASTPVTFSTAGDVFGARLPGLTHSAIITAGWDGDAEHAASSVWTYVRVRARVTLQVRANTTTRLRLRSAITPLQPHTGPSFGVPALLVEFQRRVGARWAPLGAGDACSTDNESFVKASYYHLRPGVYVLRARFVGTDYNAAAVSRPLRVTVP